jgi:hypothetical protein
MAPMGRDGRRAWAGSRSRRRPPRSWASAGCCDNRARATIMPGPQWTTGGRPKRPELSRGVLRSRKPMTTARRRSSRKSAATRSPERPTCGHAVSHNYPVLHRAATRSALEAVVGDSARGGEAGTATSRRAAEPDEPGERPRLRYIHDRVPRPFQPVPGAHTGRRRVGHAVRALANLLALINCCLKIGPQRPPSRVPRRDQGRSPRWENRP